MSESESNEALVEALAEPVSNKVRQQIFKRYGIWFSVFVAVAGYFGYDTYWDIKSYASNVEQLTKDIEGLNAQLSAFNARLGAVNTSLSLAEEKLVTVTEATEAAKEARAEIDAVKSDINALTNRNFNFVVESAGEVYSNLRQPMSLVEYYRQLQDHALEIDDKKLWRLATLRLARAYSELQAKTAARDTFREAEEAARLNFEKAEDTQKRGAFEEYLGVLLTRADEQEFLFDASTALLTLENKALPVARGRRPAQGRRARS